ncbi:MAG: hypothetical protein OIN84_01780, partial [Candidatus Methanoperedens sp.]|nr:hypothetical protein [Candidatus Methanoperedens sp.]
MSGTLLRLPAGAAARGARPRAGGCVACTTEAASAACCSLPTMSVAPPTISVSLAGVGDGWSGLRTRAISGSLGGAGVDGSDGAENRAGAAPRRPIGADGASTMKLPAISAEGSSAGAGGGAATCAGDAARVKRPSGCVGASTMNASAAGIPCAPAAGAA